MCRAAGAPRFFCADPVLWDFSSDYWMLARASSRLLYRPDQTPVNSSERFQADPEGKVCASYPTRQSFCFPLPTNR